MSITTGTQIIKRLQSFLILAMAMETLQNFALQHTQYQTQPQ